MRLVLLDIENADGEVVMAMMKQRLTTGCMLITLLWLAATVIGCGVSRSSPGLKIIPVVSFDRIAGEWEGVSRIVPEMRDDAAVMLIIRKEGLFNFVSDRGTELLLGTGTLTIVDQTVVAKGQQGTALLTLHDKERGPVLVVQAALSNGHHYYIEMVERKWDGAASSKTIH
jgi:hypothetical protein